MEGNLPIRSICSSRSSVPRDPALSSSLRLGHLIENINFPFDYVLVAGHVDLGKRNRFASYEYPGDAETALFGLLDLIM
jgi:hypothetical protein